MRYDDGFTYKVEFGPQELDIGWCEEVHDFAASELWRAVVPAILGDGEAAVVVDAD